MPTPPSSSRSSHIVAPWMWVTLVAVLAACIGIGIRAWEQGKQVSPQVVRKQTASAASAPAGPSPSAQGGLAQADDTPDCGPVAGLMPYSPIKPEDISTIVPLGNMVPPGHVLPTVHMYYNFKPTAVHNFPQKTTIYVPADMTVTRIWLFDNGNRPKPFNSYRIDFTICKQVTGYFIHPLTLNATLAAAIQPPYDQVQTSNVGNGIDHNYIKNVNVKLKAGDILGTGGGGQDLPDGVDFSLSDTRAPAPLFANPDRWKNYTTAVVCSVDYYPADIKAALYKKFGGFDYQPKDPGEPRCGNPFQDVPGTAQGAWFASDVQGDGTNDVDSQLTLGSWNLNHAQSVFSLGNKVKPLGLPSDNILRFTPASTGTKNLDFALVKPGSIYCYDTKYGSGETSGPSVLLQLLDSKTMKIGKWSGAKCEAGPWSFGQSLEYVR